VTFKENFKIVDCWMLKKRNKEQIQQSKTELRQFLQSLQNSTLIAKEKVNHLKKEAELNISKSGRVIFGEVNMLSEEIFRLKAVYDEALSYLQYFCETPIFSEALLDVDESDDYDSDTDSENDDAV
jgi:CRISPR/Cas system CSM-associated protein Csm2 small subunit